MPLPAFAWYRMLTLAGLTSRKRGVTLPRTAKASLTIHHHHGPMTDADRKPAAKAVALNYKRGEDPAPRVVASGRGEVAERIIAMALAHDVKLREDGDLVEILERIDLDETIPLEAFVAVAEILAHVYMANNRMREAGDVSFEQTAAQTPKGTI